MVAQNRIIKKPAIAGFFLSLRRFVVIFDEPTDLRQILQDQFGFCQAERERKAAVGIQRDHRIALNSPNDRLIAIVFFIFHRALLLCVYFS
jgi:hypothetical protein